MYRDVDVYSDAACKYAADHGLTGDLASISRAPSRNISMLFLNKNISRVYYVKARIYDDDDEVLLLLLYMVIETRLFACFVR